MPGTPSGENHSSPSHTWGRKRMPRPSSSEYSRRTYPLTGELSTDSPKSHRRSCNSSSSGKRIQGNAAVRTRCAIFSKSLSLSGRRARDCARSAHLGALSLPKLRARQQALGEAYDQGVMNQTVAPVDGDGAPAVMRAGELAIDRRDHIRAAAQIRATQRAGAKIVGALKCPQRRLQRGVDTLARNGRFGFVLVVRQRRDRRTQAADIEDLRTGLEDAGFGAPGECTVQEGRKQAAALEHDGCLAGSARRLASLVHRHLW